MDFFLQPCYTHNTPHLPTPLQVQQPTLPEILTRKKERQKEME